MNETKPILRVHITGPERSGIIAALAKVLLKHRVETLAMEQSALNGMLVLSILLDLTKNGVSRQNILKAIS